MAVPDPRFIAAAVTQLREQENHQLAAKFLYNLYSRELLTLAYRITDHLPLAEDMVQEVFIHSFAKIGQLKEPAHYGSWVKRILVNRCLREKRTALVFLPLVAGDLSEGVFDDHKAWYEQIPFPVIHSAIQKLPTGCRTVFTLHLMEGYKHREIADLLGIQLSTSKSQYRYALRRLREILSPQRDALHQ